MLPWLHRQLRGRWLNAIAGWPDTLSLRFPDAPPIRVVHGSPRSPWEPIYPASPDPEVAELLAETIGEVAEPLDAAWILERFPADRNAARAA